MKLLSYVLTILLFIGPVILSVAGWPVAGFDEKSKNSYYFPSFYILTVLFVAFSLKHKLIGSNLKYAITIVVFCFFCFFLNLILGRGTNTNIYFHSMALPAMYYIFYELLGNDQVIRANIKKLILLLFTFNGLMAIYERLTLTLYYPYDLIRFEFDYELDEMMAFRSSALLGHPLTNALIMSIIMTFILISDFNVIKKYSLCLIGFFSLFCFNARAAIMISAGIFALYNIRPIIHKGESLSRRFFSAILLVSFIIIGAYLFSAGFAGRFEERGNLSEDGSALARIEVFGILSQYGISNFLWGLPYKDVENMAIAVLGMTHIENWFILSTMLVGLVVTTVVTFLFIPVYRYAIKPYSRYSSFLIFISTIVLASTNNSLATGIPALSIFFACCYAFSPIDIVAEPEMNVANESIGTSEIQEKTNS